MAPGPSVKIGLGSCPLHRHGAWHCRPQPPQPHREPHNRPGLPSRTLLTLDCPRSTSATRLRAHVAWCTEDMEYTAAPLGPGAQWCPLIDVAGMTRPPERHTHLIGSGARWSQQSWGHTCLRPANMLDDVRTKALTCPLLHQRHVGGGHSPNSEDSTLTPPSPPSLTAGIGHWDPRCGRIHVG